MDSWLLMDGRPVLVLLPPPQHHLRYLYRIPFTTILKQFHHDHFLRNTTPVTNGRRMDGRYYPYPKRDPLLLDHEDVRSKTFDKHISPYL